MKIPTLEDPRVETRPIGTPYSNIDVRSGLADLGEGVQQVGGGISKVGAILEARAREARAKAKAVTVSDSMNQFQESNTSALDGDVENTRTGASGGAWGIDLTQSSQQVGDSAFNAKQRAPTGFLSTRGKEAAEKGGDTLDYLQKRRKEIADDIVDPEARQVFLEHSAQMYEASRARVESHVSQQREVAQVASAKAGAELTLNDIANNYGDGNYVEKRVEAEVRRQRALQLSPEDGAAREAEFRGNVATTLLDLRVTDAQKTGNVEGLTQQYDAVKKWLPAKLREHYEKTIEQVGKDKQAEILAAKVIGAATDDAGHVDAAKALEGIDYVEAGPLKDELRQRVEHRVLIAKEAEKERVDNVFNSAASALLSSGGNLGAVDARDKAWLLDPKNKATLKWNEILEMARAQRAHANAAPPTEKQRAAMGEFRLWAADNPDLAGQMGQAEFMSKWGWQLNPRDRETAVGEVLAHYHGAANRPERSMQAIDAAVLDVGGEGGAGVLPTKVKNRADWEPDKLDLFARATTEIQQQTAEYRKANGGKDPSPEMLRDWAKQIFLSGKVKGSGVDLPVIGTVGSKSTTLIESQMPGGAPFEPTWSDAQKNVAASALKGAGLPVDDDNVDIYLRRKHGLPSPPVRAKSAKPVEVKPEPTTTGAQVAPAVPAAPPPTVPPSMFDANQGQVPSTTKKGETIGPIDYDPSKAIEDVKGVVEKLKQKSKKPNPLF